MFQMYLTDLAEKIALQAIWLFFTFSKGSYSHRSRHLQWCAMGWWCVVVACSEHLRCSVFHSFWCCFGLVWRNCLVNMSQIVFYWGIVFYLGYSPNKERQESQVFNHENVDRWSNTSWCLRDRVVVTSTEG